MVKIHAPYFRNWLIDPVNVLSSKYWNSLQKIAQINFLYRRNWIDFFITTMDYGRPVRKLPSLHGRKSTPTPKFLGRSIFCLSHRPKFSDVFKLTRANLEILRTPNEGINQKKSEILGRCGRQNMYQKIWEWEWIFGHAVKAISSQGSVVRGKKQ